MCPAMASTGKCNPATTRLVAMRAACRSSWSITIAVPALSDRAQQRFEHMDDGVGLRRVPHRKCSVPGGRDHRLHLGVVFDRAVDTKSLLEAHFDVNAKLQHDVDQFKRAPGPLRVQTDD